MKVLFTTNIPAPYRVDFFNELGGSLDLTVLFERRSASNRDASWRFDGELSFKEYYLHGIRTGQESSFAPNVISHLDARRYDLIVIGGYSTPTAMTAIRYMQHKRIPFLLNADGGFVRSDGRIRFAAKRSLIRSASGWLSTGLRTTEYLIHYGADAGRVYTYPFSSVRRADVLSRPIDIETKREIRSQLGISEDRCVLMVAQPIHRKGIDLLIEATAMLGKDTGVYLIGGRPSTGYQKLRTDLGLNNLHFVDFSSRQQLSGYYRAADLFVLPTRFDIWGLVINEAIANGLPVVTTDMCVAGLELVKPGINGLILHAGRSDELASAIEVLVQDPRTLNRMGRESLILASEYTVESMAESHIEIFERILG